MVRTAVHYPAAHLNFFPAGLYPGTEYQISVQAIKGATEGKSSSVTGTTGQRQFISAYQPFILMCYSLTSVSTNSNDILSVRLEVD